LPANRVHSAGETIWLVDAEALPENFVNDDAGQMPCALIVMGVSGSGKSRCDKLGRTTAWSYEDGDKFFIPRAIVAKMRPGHSLTDEDRWPWLQAMADENRPVCKAGQHAVIACFRAQARLPRCSRCHGPAMFALSI